MGDVLRAATEAAWKTDPGFQVIAKYLYGNDVVLEDVLDDIAKMDPASADVHIPGQGCKCAKCKKVEKWDKNQARDHSSGKFISGGRHALRAAGEVAAAGVLGGVAATAGVKAPGMAAEAVRGARAAAQGVEHVSSAAKDAAKVAGLAGGGMVAGVAAQENAQAAHRDIKSLLRRRKAVEVAAKRASDSTQRKAAEALSITGAVAGAGGLAYAAHDAVHAARLGRKMPLKTKALIPLEVAGLGGEVLSAHKFHQDLKKPQVIKMLGEAVAKNLITPEKAFEVAKDWTKWNQEHKGKAAEGGAAGGVAGLGAAGLRTAQVRNDRKYVDSDKRIMEATDRIRAGTMGTLETDRKARAANVAFGQRKVQTRNSVVPDTGDEVKTKAVYLRRMGEDRGRLHDYKVVNGKGVFGQDRTIWRASKEGLRDAKALTRMVKNYDEDEHEVTWEGEFSKIDDDKRQVFGWASVTEIDGRPVVDLQGDYIHPTEMERAAYDYVLKSRVGGDMHSRVDEHGNKIEKADKALHVSDMIESMVFTPEKVEKLGLPEGSLPTGWWVGFKVNDEDVWKSVKDGGRKGFSIHGLGARMEKRLDEIGKSAVETLIEKAYEYSETVEEFADNLSEIYDRTGMEIFKHLEHGIHQDPMTQQTVATGNKTAIGAGVGAGVGSAIGTLAGVASGKPHGSTAGGALGSLVGTSVGAAAGHQMSKPKPVRPPSLAHLPPVAAPEVKKPVVKNVSTSNRSGSTGQRQEAYTNHYLQQATQMMAPQVAQHIQQLQQQQQMQQMMEQQALQNAPQQQNWQTLSQMGPQAGGPQGPQQPQQGPSGPVTYQQ